MFELSPTFFINSIVVASIILIIAFVALRTYRAKRKSERIRKTRVELDQFEEDILNAEKEFRIECDKDLYFSKKTLHLWKEKWKHVESVVERFSKMRPDWQMQIVSDADIQNSILRVHQIFTNGIELVKKRNDAFIDRECETYKSLFDTFEEYPFTQNQRRSIVTDECNNLVVAGAGTGKTSTIVGKVGYIIKRGLAKPPEILLLAFAKEAKGKLEERLSSRLEDQLDMHTGMPDIKTFHALGLSIIAESKGTKPSVSVLSKDSLKLREFIRRTIGLDKQQSLDDFADAPSTIGKKKNFREMLTTYFAYHLRPYRSLFEFSSFGEYIDYIKENQIRSLKGDLVRSYEECEIANFLYLNGINYVYEKDFEIPTASREHRQYQPDFYLPDYEIYIEHFGINRRGDPAPFVNKEKYLLEMAWKRNIHKKYDTKLVETFSYEKTEGILLSNLEQTLRNYGVELQPIPDEKIFEEIDKMGIGIPFADLQAKFLNLFKSGNFTLGELREKAKGYSDWQRYHAFLDIFERIYESYTAHLQQTDGIDFNDMIKQATEYVNRQQFPLNYKYILVDEFQDISQSRYRLLKSMLDNSASCKLLGVGDDWQSIYRFTGSDLAIMTNFPEFFEFTEHLCLDQTFRLNDKLCEFSSNFILKNKDQIAKTLIANTKVDSPPITLVWSEGNTERERAKDLLECLDGINSREKEKSSVFIIGRYRFLKPKGFRVIQQKFPKLDVKYYTAHGSKGRQTDYVIIVELKSDRLGFPCKIQDDPILNLVLAKEDTYPDAEERRLFYVAVTRAKKHVYLLADPKYPSSFVKEILRDNYECNIARKHEFSTIHCPNCQTGFIIKREHRGKFYSCNNYPYCDYKAKTCPGCKDGFLYKAQNRSVYQCSNESCDFNAQICPRCKDGYLVERKKYTKFLGCSNYPACRYTKSLS